MSRRLPIRLLTAFLAFAVLVPVIGCGGGSTGGKSGSGKDSDLAVIYFSHAGRTDVYRNQPLELRFTAPVKKNSVSNRTIRVLTGPNLLTPVEGALIVDGNRVVFNPTLSQGRFDQTKDPNATPDRPFGFESLLNHQLVIPGPPSPKTLKNRSGKPIVSEYFSPFTTSDLYLPELDAPVFTGLLDEDGLPTYQLGFLPEENDQGEVPFNAQIILDFSEPIAPGSMDPGVTLIVENLDVLDNLGRPVGIPGTLEPSRDGRRYLFVPSFHYGTGPFRIAVQFTQGITDLAGNPLANPRTIIFNTEFNPDVDTIGALSEGFDFNTFEDVLNTTAEWNSTVEGSLVGGAITTQVVTVHYIGDNISSRNVLVDYPLVSTDGNAVCPSWPNGVRTQMAYATSDIGVQGAVTQVFWGPASQALFAATHPNIKIRLGHTDNTSGVLSGKLNENFKDGFPTPHYDGVYHLPQDANINVAPGEITPVPDHWPFPKLTSPFDYNGVNGLFVDYQVDGANDCQLLRAYFFGIPGSPANPGNRNVVATDKDGENDNFTGGGQPLIYDIGFEIRRRLTNAQSKFYDTAQSSPNYGEPILSPPVQAGGASFTIEWQGADGMPDPNRPTRTIPDPTTYTTWSTSVDIADNHRFLRFRITLIANLNSNTVTRFDKILMPYSFRPN